MKNFTHKNAVYTILILFFSFVINSCQKIDFPQKKHEKIETSEIESIKKNVKASLKNSNVEGLNTFFRNRPILSYGSPLDTTYIGIIAPIYFKDKDIVKGLLNLKLNRKNEIIEETIYGEDEQLSSEHLDRFKLSIDLLEKSGVQFQDNLEEQVVIRKSMSKKNAPKNIDSISKYSLKKKRANTADQQPNPIAITVSFAIELYWVKTCPSDFENMEMSNLQYELRQEIENYVGRQSQLVGAQMTSYQFSLNNVRITVKAGNNLAQSPFGELSSEYGARQLLTEWFTRGPISRYECLGNRNLNVYIRNYVQSTTGGTTQPGLPGPGSGSGDLDQIPLPTFLSFISNQPYILIPNIPCPIIQNWVSTAKFVPNVDIINRLYQVSASPHIVPGLNSPIIARIQSIDNAYSSTVNMDYFSVQVNQLPVVGGERMSPANFLQYIRVNINRFVDQNRSVFTPYNYYGVNDENLWNSPNPVGAIVGIDIPGPDNGSVIVSQSNSTGWTFTTINDPKYQDHPVSGNRDFGYQQNSDGSYSFFTRGVDRITNWDATLLQTTTQLPFGQADALWMSFQSKLATFVNLNQGNASVNAPVTHRPDWSLVKQVINGQSPLSNLSANCR